MGSGTTCVAAKGLNRRYIGIEKDSNYFSIATSRVEAQPVGQLVGRQFVVPDFQITRQDGPKARGEKSQPTSRQTSRPGSSHDLLIFDPI
jgi:hypothetical protein